MLKYRPPTFSIVVPMIWPIAPMRRASMICQPRSPERALCQLLRREKRKAAMSVDVCKYGSGTLGGIGTYMAAQSGAG